MTNLHVGQDYTAGMEPMLLLIESCKEFSITGLGPQNPPSYILGFLESTVQGQAMPGRLFEVPAMLCTSAHFLRLGSQGPDPFSPSLLLPLLKE